MKINNWRTKQLFDLLVDMHNSDSDDAVTRYDALSKFGIYSEVQQRKIIRDLKLNLKDTEWILCVEPRDGNWLPHYYRLSKQYIDGAEQNQRTLKHIEAELVTHSCQLEGMQSPSKQISRKIDKAVACMEMAQEAVANVREAMSA